MNSVEQPKKLVLVGDSTLDNVVWVSKYEQCIKAQLEAALPQLKIINLAADGFTSKNVLEGEVPTISYKLRSKNDPFPVENGKSLKPLEQLEKLSNVEFVVLSIGGNDLRKSLYDFSKMTELTQVYLKNYFLIMERLFKITPKIIIMMQYKPSLSNDFGIYEALQFLPFQGTPNEKMNFIMENIYPSIINLARKHKLPLVDLPNSFNNKDDDLYKSQIQPSSKGGKIITEIIEKVVKDHSFTESKFYYKAKNGSIQTTIKKQNQLWNVFNDY